MKITTKDAVRIIREINPEAKASLIARSLGVSRERVRQLLRELGFPTTIPRPIITCIDCGKRLKNDGRNNHRRCYECHLKFFREQQVILICDECGREFAIKPSIYKARQKYNRQHTFCSKQCQGKWCGTHYGFRSG